MFRYSKVLSSDEIRRATLLAQVLNKRFFFKKLTIRVVECGHMRYDVKLQNLVFDYDLYE
ncbi:unnamed protein product [Ixodes persulcatus]